MTILDEILEFKRREVERAVGEIAPDEMERRALAMPRAGLRGFRAALKACPAPAIIAELKRRSPSKGVIREHFEPCALASDYVRGGAAALSVLTDEHYFGGHLSYLSRVREKVALPLLRKDFVVSAYQIDEARVAGADAILLIVAALPADELAVFYARAAELGLDALVEVHDESALETALGVGATLIGVNNRDLRTFEVDLGVTERLAARLPDDAEVVLVAESGISGPDAIRRLEKAGANAFLVGESLMREADVGLALRNLRRQQ